MSSKHSSFRNVKTVRKHCVVAWRESWNITNVTLLGSWRWQKNLASCDSLTIMPADSDDKSHVATFHSSEFHEFPLLHNILQQRQIKQSNNETFCSTSWCFLVIGDQFVFSVRRNRTFYSARSVLRTFIWFLNYRRYPTRVGKSAPFTAIKDFAECKLPKIFFRLCVPN